MSPFIVFSLPRSRSTWLSLFLSYGGRQIGHDIGVESSSPADFFDRLSAGTCETGAAFAWRAIKKLRPDVKFAVVLRDPLDVAKSLERLGAPNMLAEMQARDDDLWDILTVPGTLALEYDQLATEAGCREIFEFCTGEPFDAAWWRRFDPINIQVDIPKQFARLAQNRETIEALKADVRSYG